jgi:DNA polymerase III epsilon subunit-like protein
MSKKRKYAIIDIETTGGLVKRDKITEIAIVLHDGEDILDQYQTLINPDRSIPEFISRQASPMKWWPQHHGFMKWLRKLS